MTTLREAAQQALEALAAMTTARCGGDDGMDISPINAAYDKAESALTALRAALAQQAEPLTIERLRDALVASRIIQPAAVEDPEEYDGGVTLHRIEALHRRIT